MRWFGNVQLKNIGTYMSSPSIKPSVSIIHDERKIFGISIKEKRLVFQDPHGKLLNHQVKRWRPEKNQVDTKKENKGLISGIKVHSKAIHILCQVLYVLSLGYLNKSISVVLEGKRIYLNTNSLQKWRRLNHEALLSLEILKSSSRKDLAKVRQEELTALNALLKLLPKDRPKRKKTIIECSDSFEIASTAIQLARAKVGAGNIPNVDREKLESATYAIAAFYILLTSEIKVPACGEEMLEVGMRNMARNFAASEDELARLTDAGNENLENKIKELEERRKELEEHNQDATAVKKLEHKARLDLNLFGSIREVYEDTQEGVKRRFFNKTPDLFSSLQTRNNPVQAKKLLDEILKNNEKFALSFTSTLLNSTIKDKGSVGSSAQEKEFFQHIMSLGTALKEQFTPQDPGALLKYVMQSSFVQILPIIKKEEQTEDLNLFYKIGTLTAWNLLKSPSTITHGSDGSQTLTCVIEEPHTLSMRFPPKNFFDNQECSLSSKLPFINALAGKLIGEDKDTPICYNEAFDFVRAFKELFPEEVIVLEEIVKRMTLNPLENEKGHKAPETILKELGNELGKGRSEIARDFSNARQQRLSEFGEYYHTCPPYDEEAFDQLASLYTKLEKMGELIYYRYLTRYLNEFLEKIDFEDNGKIKINPSLYEGTLQVRRTPEEHKKMIKTYFPNFTIPQMQKKEPPQFKPRENLRLASEDYLSHLFTKLVNHVGSSGIGGSCCVGALAQGIFKSEDASSKREYILAIRNAASNYMKAHPEQFFGLFLGEGDYTNDKRISILSEVKNPSDSQKRELNQLQTEKVFRYANGIAGTDYFSHAALKAISLIIERPIYVVVEEQGHIPYKLESNGEIMMGMKINPEINGEVLYLHLNDIHYHGLKPKRVGTTNI